MSRGALVWGGRQGAEEKGEGFGIEEEDGMG